MNSRPTLIRHSLLRQGPVTAHPINPMKHSSDNTQTLAISRQLSYETTSVSQPLTAVNPLNPIKSQFRQPVNAHELSSTAQMRNPARSASLPNTNGPAAIGNIFSRCFKTTMQLPWPVCLDRCMHRPYNPLVTNSLAFPRAIRYIWTMVGKWTHGAFRF